jgi:thiol-disulfide isomerase/thioredoxin
MRHRHALALAALVLAAPALRAQQTREASSATLKTGMVAPALSVEKWVKGTPVERFEPGKVYVVEFWATWCGPCIASMPHLTALQKEYRGDGVTIIGMTSVDKRNSLEQVEKMVADKGDGMGYTVAWDRERTTNRAFMEAAEQNGIPCSFVVDKQGKVAYIGLPMFLDEPLAEIVEGTWDLAKDPAQLEADQQVFFDLYGGAGSDPKGTLEKLGAFEQRHPKLAPLTDPLRFQVALAAQDFIAAYTVAGKIVERATAAGDAQQLNEIAWAIVDPEQKLSNRDLALALRAAEKAAELTGSKDANILDTLARVHATMGNYAKAIELQTQAIAAAPEKQKAGLTPALEEYKAKGPKQ